MPRPERFHPFEGFARSEDVVVVVVGDEITGLMIGNVEGERGRFREKPPEIASVREAKNFVELMLIAEHAHGLSGIDELGSPLPRVGVQLRNGERGLEPLAVAVAMTSAPPPRAAATLIDAPRSPPS